MKVYVDSKDIELTKELFERANVYDWYNCNLDDELELVSLTDYTKRVRKEVVEKIKKYIDTQLDFYNTELDEDDDNYAVGYVGGLKWVKDVLDLMEGEIK